MIRNIFPLMLLFILVNPITRISDGETFFQDNSETLITLSSQSSKILADFQGEDKMDTQRNESSPRDLIRKELDNNRINNLKINVLKPLSEIEKKALRVPQKTSRAFLMFVHPVESYPNSGHLKVDKVIELPSLPAIAEWELIPIEWELREWRTR